MSGGTRRCIGEAADIETIYYSPPTFSTADSEFYRLIEAVTASSGSKGNLFAPNFLRSTDSKFLRNLEFRPMGSG